MYPGHTLKLQETITPIQYNRRPCTCSHSWGFFECQCSCLQGHRIHSISVHCTFMEHWGLSSELSALPRAEGWENVFLAYTRWAPFNLISKASAPRMKDLTRVQSTIFTLSGRIRAFVLLKSWKEVLAQSLASFLVGIATFVFRWVGEQVPTGAAGSFYSGVTWVSSRLLLGVLAAGRQEPGLWIQVGFLLSAPKFTTYMTLIIESSLSCFCTCKMEIGSSSGYKQSL